MKNVVIYGAGGNGIKIYHALKSNNYNVIFFIDLYSNKRVYDGVKIYTPDLVPRKNIQVLVSVSCYSNQIARLLKKQGHEKCYDFNQCMKLFPCLLNEFFLRESLVELKKKTAMNLDKLKILSSLLKDYESKKTLERVIAFRLKPSSETYIENDWKVQYFSDDLPISFAFRESVTMVDCGAYIGDTLPIALDFFNKNKIKVNSITLFEPNLDNNFLLQKNIEKFTSSEYLLVNYPCGVWSKNTTLNFKLGADTSHIVSHDMGNTEKLQVVALDAVAYSRKPNFIKMDIEGAELEAIKGAKKIIKEYNPVLAISVYHLTSHLWDVAFLINKFNPNYDYYLRTHGDLGNEIILYALPRSL